MEILKLHHKIRRSVEDVLDGIEKVAKFETKHIMQVMKLYFLFVVFTMLLSAVFDGGDGSRYYTSIVDSGLNGIGTPVEFEIDTTFDDGKSLVAGEVASVDFSLSIENNPENAYATNGMKNAEIMKFVLKAGVEDVTFESLRVKIEGVHPLAVESAILTHDLERISKGKRSNEYFNFKGFDFELAAGESAEISLMLTLSEGLNSGDRIRVDIDSPEDIQIEIGGEPYTLNEYYPINGKYLSIVNHRKWLSIIRSRR